MLMGLWLVESLCGKSVFIPPIRFPLLTATKQVSLYTCFKSHKKNFF